MSSIVKLESISKIFSRGFFRKRVIWALREVTLEIRRKQIISLVGESGSGKTTLGKIITSLIMPTYGRVSWEDVTVIENGRIVDPDLFKKYKNRYIYVHQDPYTALNPSKNVWSTLKPVMDKYMPHAGEADKYKYAKELLEEVGLVPPEYFMDKYPHHLSGGMKQRLMLARALIVDPYLIVTDEIVSMVDPSIRVSIINLLKDLVKGRSISIVFISHDLGVAAYAAEDNPMYVMLKGVVVEAGPAYEILSSPKHPYTRALISNIPIPIPPRNRIVRDLTEIILESERNIKRESICPFASLCPLYDNTCNSLTLKDYKKINQEHISLCVKADKLPQWSPKWYEEVL